MLEPHQALREVVGEAVGSFAVLDALSRHGPSVLPGDGCAAPFSQGDREPSGAARIAWFRRFHLRFDQAKLDQWHRPHGVDGLHPAHGPTNAATFYRRPGVVAVVRVPPRTTSSVSSPPWASHLRVTEPPSFNVAVRLVGAERQGLTGRKAGLQGRNCAPVGLADCLGRTRSTDYR